MIVEIGGVKFQYPTENPETGNDSDLITITTSDEQSLVVPARAVFDFAQFDDAYQQLKRIELNVMNGVKVIQE